MIKRKTHNHHLTPTQKCPVIKKSLARPVKVRTLPNQDETPKENSVIVAKIQRAR
jgi:hypothetical protein